MPYEVRRIRSQQEVNELNAMVRTAILRDLEKKPVIDMYIDFSEISYPRDKDSVFVARCDGKIIGATQYYSDDSVSIEQIYVHPDHRLKGIGRRLLKSIEKVAMKQGKKKIFVQSTLALIDFYEKYGYEPITEGSEIMKKKLKLTKEKK